MADENMRLLELVKLAHDRIILAHEALQHRAPGEKLFVAYSGGKDSECIVQLCIDVVGKDAIEINYNATGIDPPEVVKHIKQQFRKWGAEGIECHFHKPAARMHDLIVKHGPPTCRKRFCCEYLKESASVGRITITGVRWAESRRRRDNHGVMTQMAKRKENRAVYNNDNDIRRRITEECVYKSRLTVNPIIDWETSDVWAYIRAKGVSYCSLYDEGYHRLGCVGCPMAGRKGRQRDFAQWPHFKKYYLKAFAAFLAKNPEHYAEKYGWHTVDDLFHWWIQDGVVSGQVGMDLEGEMQYIDEQSK